MADSSFYGQLQDYGKSDYYPYHMPGHKRKRLGNLSSDLLEADITEIEGFDNLHQPEGLIKGLQEKAAVLYGAEESFYLVNGSTCGILSAISAAVPEGGRLLMARDSHRSVYHAAYLRRLRTAYLYSQQVEGFAFHEAVAPEEVEAALARESDVAAVLIVSPTYEGRIADVVKIAEIVHGRGIPLIVDEAHGAHLGFAEGFASNSCKLGADLVIHSVHKTLPAMTQTALLHVNGGLIDRDVLKRFLHIYQSSSPSYVLMASIADALDIVERQGSDRFRDFREQYSTLIERLQVCRYLHFVPLRDVERGRQDMGKLVISADGELVSGQWLYEELLERYHLQCEMAGGNYCLAMFTIADGPEAYRRMGDALMEIDGRIAGKVREGAVCAEQRPYAEGADCRVADGARCRVLRQDTDKMIPLADAWDMPWEMTLMSDAIGRPVADFINLYPPGTPLLAPGEILTGEIYGQIRGYIAQGLNVRGVIK